ncbi:MAG: alanine--tRNA ligase [Clostridia bacterium]|nr:alanine--tRNA ligase [Clostridia bacterium]
MQWMSLNEIREKFLSFFESKGHLRLPSASLIPQDDKSLLIINSGMAPLKPYFTGKITPPRRRVTTCQKCIRTPDIERVGKTARHGTYFEMLGNFSFGDYFKHEATAWAWEFCTKVLELPPERLYISVYENDDEAFDIWTKELGVDPSHMVRLGKEDNFWEIGSGPCGPCSEIYFDRGPEWGCGKPDCAVGCDCDRYIEFWNLVFTQFDGDGNGNYAPLEHPNIDTGMGLERMACIMQNVANLFEVDTVMAITKKVSEIVGVHYRENEKSDVSLRVITDHIRSTTMMLSDGIMPSNEGRGYVLRRLLRRAARHGKLLGYNKAFLYQVVDTVVDCSGEAYPNLIEKREFIKKIIKLEEERFSETVDAGLDILGKLIEEHRKSGVLPGDDAFRLYDTFGFPIDLTREILEEQGMTADEERFEELMTEQRERARAARSAAVEAGWDEGVLDTLPKELTTSFIGYDQKNCEAISRAFVVNGALAESIQEGDHAIVITDQTVFYPEGGGQVGDVGVMEGEHFKGAVVGTHKLPDGKILHQVAVEEGFLELGDKLSLTIDYARRMDATRNHTATHLLNMALRRVLGDHVTQAGSLVEPGRIRFDFTHFEAMTDEQLAEVESIVNEAIFSATQTNISNMPLAEAKKLGAIADFGEKYGEIVRVVDIPGLTTDLCGGCHLKNTSEAGLFKILSEGGISAGVRRIEAVSGRGLLEFLASKEETIAEAASILKAKPAELVAKARSLMNEQKAAQQTIEQMRGQLAGAALEEVLASGETVEGVLVLASKLKGQGIEEMRSLGDRIKSEHEKVFLLLAGDKDDKLTFFATATKGAVESGAHCGNLIREVAAFTGGKGGGKPDTAQAGGKDTSKVDEALLRAQELMKVQLSK